MIRYSHEITSQIGKRIAFGEKVRNCVFVMNLFVWIAADLLYKHGRLSRSERRLWLRLAALRLDFANSDVAEFDVVGLAVILEPDITGGPFTRPSGISNL